MRRPRAAAAVVLVLAVLALLVSGCGDDSPPTSSLPTQAPDLWNPCDGLPVKRVEAMFDTRLSVSTGTADVPECRFSPATKGDPAISANYSLVPGTLDDLIDTFGNLDHQKGTRVLEPTVKRSDGARLVVHVGKHTLAVSGFVKNGNLVQSFNVVDLGPYRRAALVRGSTELLEALAAHADDSGLTGS